MKAYTGVQLKLLGFWNPVLPGGKVVNLTFRPLYPVGKSSRYPLDRRVGVNLGEIRTGNIPDSSLRESILH
jgi:hypothetical protein